LKTKFEKGNKKQNNLPDKIQGKILFISILANEEFQIGV
jgi:hypothetical protein